MKVLPLFRKPSTISESKTQWLHLLGTITLLKQPEIMSLTKILIISVGIMDLMVHSLLTELTDTPHARESQERTLTMELNPPRKLFFAFLLMTESQAVAIAPTSFKKASQRWVPLQIPTQNTDNQLSLNTMDPMIK